jgi:Putative transposase/Transposase zinc-binding domain
MRGEHPIKQFLIDTRKNWDHPGTDANVRETFHKIINCGTIALGAEVYASGTELKIVHHTCKSRFCTSCGQRDTEAWQEDLEAILPDIPYVGITLTMPDVFWPILQQNRHLLHGMPAMGAEAIQLWVNARYGVRVLLIVVQHTFGGFLNFYPHLHVLVSEGGLQESEGRWIAGLKYGKRGFVELMRAWRYAVIAYLAEALKGKVLRSELSAEELETMFETQYKRGWNIDISRTMSKAHFLKYVGRYIRRPPVAQHRLKRITDQEVEYVAKDTRNDNKSARRGYSNEEFLAILKEQVPDRSRNNMRYFGLLSPRSKARTWAAVFVLLRQKQRPHPRRSSWRWLLRKTFGIDPLLDSFGEVMHWVGRRSPVASC